MSDNIFTSILVCSRKRPLLLSENLSRMYKFASYPDNTESLIRVDDDDQETIEEYRKGEFFKSHRENVKMYVGPRFGYTYLPVMHKQLYLLSKGDIIVQFGDDCRPRLKKWDKICLQYKDTASVIGWNMRQMITRKAIEKYEFLKNFGEINPNSDGKINEFALQNGIFIKIKNWWKKVQPHDRVKKEGRFGEWHLEDLSVLNNLSLQEVSI